MRTRAAVLREVGAWWSIEEVDLGAPKAHEVMVKLRASGLCHSDDHLRTGDTRIELPVIGGHEGAGVVVELGPAVENVAVGDHVVLSFIPSCGHCWMCSTGHQNLCDLGAHALEGPAISDGTYRVTSKGQGIGRFCQLGTFSPYVTVHEASVVKVDPTIPLDVAALVGCGVPTGYGSAVYAAQVQPGDTCVVVGIGGVGINAVQGARIAGAEIIVAVDPVEMKHSMAQQCGATHVTDSIEKALDIVRELTLGRMADSAILTVGIPSGDQVQSLLQLVKKNGRAVVTAVAPWQTTEVSLNLQEFVNYQKQLIGVMFGWSNPRYDIPRILRLYQHGKLFLDQLITHRYSLDQINDGYRDLLEGRNLRGLIDYEYS
ncbi:MAG: NDMA-dependent alcohol dehydrogenase [Actinobacteria bacterium]|nr:NDMA-dependent alcohol dehydrogenase [Actinomycetota bacterium]